MTTGVCVASFDQSMTTNTVTVSILQFSIRHRSWVHAEILLACYLAHLVETNAVCVGTLSVILKYKIQVNSNCSSKAIFDATSYDDLYVHHALTAFGTSMRKKQLYQHRRVGTWKCNDTVEQEGTAALWTTGDVTGEQKYTGQRTFTANNSALRRHTRRCSVRG